MCYVQQTFFSENTTRQEDIPRRPSMTKLCKRLRVKHHDNPVKIGKEIAERLEEVGFIQCVVFVTAISNANNHEKICRI